MLKSLRRVKMMSKFTGRTVSLLTYGYGEQESRMVVLPIEWLTEKVGNYHDYLAEYTYDDSQHLEDQFRRDVRAHYEPLIEEALSNYDEDDEENNHLQCTWLEESGGHKEEWVLNVGTIIIEDEMSEKEAERLFYILT
jgi:hypothetical protein